MKIVLDLQACQGESRDRGIGRYSWALARAMLLSGRDRHEFWIALNGAFPDAAESIRREFGGRLLPPERIVMWNCDGPVAARDVRNERRLERGLAVREAFLRTLRPDFVHISSMFEGMNDDSLQSVPVAADAAPTAVTLYDLIPLLNREHYLPNPVARDWYYRQLDSLRRARLLLAISESSRREALECLDWPEDRVVNISSAVDATFRQIALDDVTASGLRQKFGLRRPFVMCAGVVEVRKNIDALIRAFSALPTELRTAHQLVLVGKVGDHDRARFAELIYQGGLRSGDVVFTGFVDDDDLVGLYNLCKLFVFPSWHEGFGLPALEAMACGAPVIAASTSSLPEVVGREDALFNPHEDASITVLMERALRDDNFRATLAKHSVDRAKQFSWAETAHRALDAMEKAANEAQYVPTGEPQPRLAYVPLASAARSGTMQKYMEVIRRLSDHYDVELITDEPNVDPTLPASWAVRSTRWFLLHPGIYDRVMYHTTDLPCSESESACMQRIPGTVVVHRSSAADIIDLLASEPASEALLRSSVYRSWGYRVLAEADRSKNWHVTLSQHPSIYGDLEGADGWCIMPDASHVPVMAARSDRASTAVLWLSDRLRRSGTDRAGTYAGGAAIEPVAIASALREAIERFHSGSRNVLLHQALSDLVARTHGITPEDDDVACAAQAVADMFPPALAQRQLLVDISRLVVTDARSGIQRVVRSHLMNLLRNSPKGFRVEPVYSRHEECFYRYARRYTCSFLDIDPLPLEDDRLDASPGDVFLGLDLAADIIPARKDCFLDLRRRGISTHFVLYDMLAGHHPEWFPEDLVFWMRKWYETIGEISDGIVAISHTSAKDLRDWLDKVGLQRSRPLPISWVHLGADIDASVPSRGIDPAVRRSMATWRGGHVFLMVGTVEPRKGQGQALDAFEELWAAGHDERLVIVGRQGWRMEALAQRLRDHAELGKRLFWFEGISDEALAAVYAAASALLVPSLAEGFGLPLIEAAQHGLPILARDLPVFREVAGDAATYFDAPDAKALAEAIVAWVRCVGNGGLPDVKKLQFLTWTESTAQLLDSIEGKRPSILWQPSEDPAAPRVSADSERSASA